MIRTSVLLVACPLVLLAALAADSARAADIQVSTGGSISTAIASASAGDRVLVQAGTYAEHVVLKNGVELRGGYDGTFSEGARNPLTNVTVIDGSGSGPAVFSGSTVGATTVVDGFVLTGGGGSPGVGVLVAGGAPVFRNNEISNNVAAGIAGGVYVHSGSAARFENNRIQDNSSAGSGGGMRVESSPAVLVGNTFENNDAPHSGGGLYVFHSALACSSNTFRGNTAGEGGGGGIYIQFATGVQLVGNTFENNEGPYGGGVFARDESSVALIDNTFTDCRATVSGGGVAGLTFSDFVFIDDRFDACTAVSGGGGVWLRECTFSMVGDEATEAAPSAYFRDCTAGGTGGGVSTYATDGTIEAVRFSTCTGDSLGGGIYGRHSRLDIRRNVIESCTSQDGGAIALQTALPDSNRTSTVVHNTIWGCRGTGTTNNPAGGVQLWGVSVINVANFAGNIVANTLQGACIRCGRGGAAGTPFIQCVSVNRAASNPTPEIPGAAANGCVTAWNSNATNVIEDPKFCNAPTDYRLQSCSPAVDTNVCSLSAGKDNRGAAPDDTECACFLAVEAQTWGKIKALYR